MKTEQEGMQAGQRWRMVSDEEKERREGEREGGKKYK